MIIKMYKIRHKLIVVLILFLINIKHHEMVNGNELNEEDDDDDGDFKGCYNDKTNPYLLFGTKTSYITVVPEEQNIIEPPEGCTAKMLWVVIRHGIRYTVRSEEFLALYRIRDEILYNHHHKKNVNLCEKDIENLRNWYFTMGEEQENYIHENGLEEVRELARRYRKKFPELLKPPYVPEKYWMKVSNTTTGKTLESGQAFLETMFPYNPLVKVHPAVEEDLLVQIYTPCINTMAKTQTKEKRKDYFSTDIFQKLLRNITERLGLNSLLPQNVERMYKMCRFDKGWQPDKVSPWCGIFTTEELQILEYFQDYKYHFKSGYGSRDFSKKLGCPIVRDFMMRFKDINEDNIKDAQPDAIFYMAHTMTLNTLLVGLGIAEDSKDLTPTNYEQLKNRKWRTSYNAPFGANFAALFYQCESGNNRVIIYLNEKPVLIDGCGEFMCPFDVLYNKFKEYIDNKTCDVSELCENEYDIWSYLLWAASIIASAIIFRYLFRRIWQRNRRIFYKFIKLFKKEEKKHIV